MTRLIPWRDCLTASRVFETAHTLAHAVACVPAAAVIAWRLVAWDVGEMRAKRGAK